jgi:hypothetical protein
MASASYLSGRKKYDRPQAVLWSNNAGTLIDGVYVPIGYEVGADQTDALSQSYLNQFLILSDHNRSPINIGNERIEKRERMINGRMRSYHVADKLKFDFSWDMLPSRSYASVPEFNKDTGKSSVFGKFGLPTGPDSEYTVDGGAGGVELLDWYESHTGSFWMFLAYDKYTNFGSDDNAYGHLAQYNQIVEVFISKFDYSIQKRGNSNLDLWNISVSLEEV